MVRKYTLLVVLLLFFCHDSNAEQAKDLGFNGPVKSATTTGFIYEENFGQWVESEPYAWYQYYEFDQTGNVSVYLEPDTKNPSFIYSGYMDEYKEGIRTKHSNIYESEIVLIQVWSYNQKQQIQEIRDYDNDGSLFRVRKRFYNEVGNLVEETYFDNVGNFINKTLFLYDSLNL